MKIFLRKQVFSLIVATVIFGTLLVAQNSEAGLLYNIKSRSVILDYGGIDRPADESSMLWVDGNNVFWPNVAGPCSWMAGTTVPDPPGHTPVPARALLDRFEHYITGYLTFGLNMGMTQGDYNINVGDSIIFEIDSGLPVFTADNGIGKKITYGKWYKSTDPVLSWADQKTEATSEGIYLYEPGGLICCAGTHDKCCTSDPLISQSARKLLCFDECQCDYEMGNYFLFFRVQKRDPTFFGMGSLLDCVPIAADTYQCTAKQAGTTTLRANFLSQTAIANIAGKQPSYFVGDYSDNDVSESKSFVIPGMDFTWNITISNAAPVPGACGNASGAYTPADVVWRTPACATGTPSADPTLTPFLTSGETKNWQCTGAVGAPANCSATMGLATPIVTLSAAPNPLMLSLKADQSGADTADTTLTWSISNVANACGIGCNCELTQVGNSTTLPLPYPATNNLPFTLGYGTGSHDFSVKCTNPSGLSAIAPATVSTQCNPTTWTAACDKACGGGNEIEYSLNASCNINPTGTSTPCNPQPCPTGTSWKEVRP